MNIESTGPTGIAYDDTRPVILIASNSAAAQRARELMDQRHVRIGAQVSIQDGRKRLAEQAVTGAVWIEIERDAGGALVELLHELRYDSTERGYGAVVSTTSDLADLVISALGQSKVQVLVDPDADERKIALEQAVRKARIADRIADVASEGPGHQLRELAKEMSLIAAKLARLTADSAVGCKGGVLELDAERMRKVIRARRARHHYFSEGLFADPAWDMLLDLLHAELAGVRVPVSSLCIAAAVPATTALRWIKTLASEELVIRRSDPHDARRIFVELTPKASKALREYFSEIDDFSGY